MMTTLTKSFVVLTLAGLVGCSSAGQGTPINSGAEASRRGSDHAEIGKQAPDLSIQSLNGKGKINLESLQGKIVIVDFWATWCAPCRASFPQLEGLSKKMGDQVVVVGISVDDEKTNILEFAKDTGATFAIGWDDGHSIAERWQVKNMPTSFILDKTGTVRHIHGGYHDGEATSIEKELNALAEEGPSGTRVAKADKSEDKKSEDKTVASAESPETVSSPASQPTKKAAPKKRSNGKKTTKKTTKTGKKSGGTSAPAGAAPVP